ncbi:MAG: hydantoinase/oxoprolinase family protein [Acidimicrobiia bacterium]|nr:hydantoinase/oxoprolinase family protein [Acidimicrobiia bacterium]
MGYRVGVDVGGTFTDLICVTPDNRVLLDKTPTTLDDQSVGVMNGLGQLAEELGLSPEELCAELDILVHGTTTADNTMIEMDGATTGLLVTEGHRDEIEMRRVHKEQIWDPAYPAPTPIARRRARIPIPERCAFDGRVLLELDEDAVRRGVQRLRQLGCTSIAVMYLFSFVNPAHEERTREIVLEEFPEVEHVSLSHEVMPKGPEFERVSTTLVNAYVAPRLSRYLSNLSEKLRSGGYGGELLIMHSTGGVMPPDYVARRAVSLLASGPTGGVMGASLAARHAGTDDFVAVDMGGTSYDLCLVRGGRPEVKTDWNWRYRYYIGLPMVDVRSVGAGGGSIARVRQGALLVGPESAGSDPGPACYGRGGDRPTVTDADAVLGFLPPEGFAGGRMHLDVDAARAGHRARRRRTARGRRRRGGLGHRAHRQRQHGERHPEGAVGLRRRRPRPGDDRLRRQRRGPRLGDRPRAGHRPRARPADGAGVLSARTAGRRLPRRPHQDPRRAAVPGRPRHTCARSMRDVNDDATKELAPTGLTADAVDRELFVQMSYAGQNFDMSVPCPEGDALDDGALMDLAERFHDLHERDRGFSFRNQMPTVRGVRLIAEGHTPKPDHLGELGTVTDPEQARRGTRSVYFGVEFVDAPVYDGARLGAGATVEGPALVEEPFTVVVVPPGHHATLADHTSWELHPNS